MEGSAYLAVADALEREGLISYAEPLWRRAAEVEPTNPTYLLRRAQALYTMDREGEANALVDSIVAKKWHGAVSPD